MNGDIDFVLYLEVIAYPVVGLLVIETISRVAKFPNWVKLLTQALMCVVFGIVYLTTQVAHWLTGTVLLALAFALFYQAKLSKTHPEKAMY